MLPLIWQLTRRLPCSQGTETRKPRTSARGRELDANSCSLAPDREPKGPAAWVLEREASPRKARGEAAASRGTCAICSRRFRGCGLHEQERVGPSPGRRPRPPHTRGARPARASERISVRPTLPLRPRRPLPTARCQELRGPGTAEGREGRRHRLSTGCSWGWAPPPARQARMPSETPTVKVPGGQMLTHVEFRDPPGWAWVLTLCCHLLRAALGKSFSFSEPRFPHPRI